MDNLPDSIIYSIRVSVYVSEKKTDFKPHPEYKEISFSCKIMMQAIWQEDPVGYH